MPTPVTSSLTPPSATAVDAPMTSEGAPMLAPSPVATEVAEQRGSPNSTAERDSLSESLISMPSTMRYVLPYGASANGLTMAGERATELAQLRQRCAQQEATITRLRQERDALKRQVRNQPAPAAISLFTNPVTGLEHAVQRILDRSNDRIAREAAESTRRQINSRRR